MAKEIDVKIYEHAKNKYSMSFRSDFINDTTFPFKIKEPLVARFEGQRMIIEKKKTTTK
jgi:hypothetical protein